MSNSKLSLGMGGLIILFLFISSVVIVFVTESHSDISASNGFMQFLVDQHIWIMASLVIISASFGFFWAHILYKQVENTSKTSNTAVNLVLEFLSKEEKNIVNYLIRKEGRAKQSELSKIEGMNKVKVHRTLQKMKEKNLVMISSEGKVRKVSFRKEIYDMIKNMTKNIEQ